MHHVTDLRVIRTAAAAAILSTIGACVSPAVVEKPQSSFRYTDFHTVFYSVHETQSTEIGSGADDKKYAQEVTGLFDSLLGVKLKSLGYQLVAATDDADLSIDIPIDEAKPGNAAGRMFVGFGVGRAAFEYTAHFTSRGHSLGVFTGGRSFTGMELNQSPFSTKDEMATNAASRSASQIEDYLTSGGAINSAAQQAANK